MIVRYISARCGAGKTKQIINRACELARHHKRVIVLQPTKQLIERTVQQELRTHRFAPNYYVFHEDTVTGSVAREITRFLNETEDAGQIIFATHQVLPYIPYFANKHDWHLIVDEEMQILRYRCHRIPKTHGLITDDIELADYNSIYSQVVSRNRRSLEGKGRNRDEDELLRHLSETIRILTNSNWLTYVNTEQYERLCRGEIKTLAFHSVLKPQLIHGFASVFMAAANFEDTALYGLWSQSMQFEPDHEFSRSLRFSQHENGDLITIYYAVGDQWSRKLLETTAGSNDTRNVRDHLIEATKQLFGREEFLWQANKSFQENSFGTNAHRLPNKPHGLNSYANIHNIAFLSSLNPTTDHFKFLQTQGLSGGDVRTAIYYTGAYQSVMRTSIRDPRNQQPKRILVPDRGLAEYLHELFPGSRIERLDIGIPIIVSRKTGRPRKHGSNRERVAAQRQKSKQKKMQILVDQLLLLKNCQDALVDGWCEGNGSRCRAESSIDSYSSLGTSPQDLSDLLVPDFHHQSCCGTLYPDKFASIPTGYLGWVDVESFIQILSAFHRRKLSSKERNFLFSPAVFDPYRGTGKHRGTGNIVYVRNVWLDFEDGHLQPKELPQLFPHVQMLGTNTFRHTAEKPRFRVIIPTTQPVTPEAYLLLYENIAWKLEDAGYFVQRNRKRPRTGQPRSGLDWSKRHPTSLFYLPCQAEDTQESFFFDCNDGARTLLDPMPWIENGEVSLQPELPAFCDSNGNDKDLDQARVGRAIAAWRAIPKGQGNEGFFRLALECKRAGLDPRQVEEVLQNEAEFARSPSERKSQIAGILESLRKGPTKSHV
jgi:hypothetical protein